MAERYSRSLLRVAVAQICQNLGWNAIQSTPIELLTDILERYLVNVGCTVHDYAEQFGRTAPNLNDVGLAFHDLGINLEELADYVDHVEPAQVSEDLPKFPAPRPSQLEFPPVNSREIKEREEHIYDYLPLMFPSKEEESPEKFNLNGNNREGVMQVSPMAPMAPMTAEKRPMSSPVDLTPPPAKRARILPEEAAHSQYEMKGVMMTTTGFLTPTRGQGKLPDSRTPPPPTPGTTPGISMNLNPLLTAPDSPPSVDDPPAVFTETVQEKTVTDDDPEFRPEDNDSLNSAASSVRNQKTKETGKKGRPRGRGKGRAGRSPKQGQSPGRGRSPKGVNKASEPKPRELFPHTSVAKPVQDPMEVSPESPKLMIDEEKGLQKEAAEAREKRLAAYDNTIDDVIKRVMSKGDQEEEEECKAAVESPVRPPIFPNQEESLTSLIHPPPPPIDENEEERQRRRNFEVQQELEHIQERKKEWERQERQRIEKIEREIRIDDTINDVIRNAGVNSDDDNHPYYADAEPIQQPLVSNSPLLSPPAKEPNVFDFEEEDFSPPTIPDIPMSPQHVEPAADVVPKEKTAKTKKKGRGAGRSPGSAQKVKDKLKKKLQKQEQEYDVPEWPPPNDEPLDLTDRGPPKEELAPKPFSISIPELAEAAEAMKPEPSPPLVQPLKIKALKEEKEHSSKKEKKKKKNKDRDKDKDKDKSKEKKKDKKDKEKKKDKDKKDKDKKEKDKEGNGVQSVPKLTFRFGVKNEVSVEPEPPKPDLVPKLVLKKPAEQPPPPRVPTKAAMKQAPMANIPPPAPVLRPPTPSPPSSPSLPPSPPMEARVATPPPPSKFTSPPPPAAKAREVTPPPPPSASLRSKANPTPVLTVETVGADAPARAVYTETVGSFYDENGEKVWICPGCKMQDDGSPMVGCDKCDDWYHYPCVGIVNDPPENEPWYCPRCNARRSKESSSSSRGRGRKKRKNKK